VWEITNGGKIVQAIKKRYPFASPGAAKALEGDLKRLVGPVILQLRDEVKEWEREAESARDDAGYAWSEAGSLNADIERMEAEQERQKMLEQFYSY
jgi:hypothetical protein